MQGKRVYSAWKLLTATVCVPLYWGNVMYTASIHFNQEYVCMPGLSASNWYALTIELFCFFIKFQNKSRGREHERFACECYFQNAADCYLLLFLIRNLIMIWTFCMYFFNDKAVTCLSCLEMISKGWWATERVLHELCVAVKNLVDWISSCLF